MDLSVFRKKFCGDDHDREIAFRAGFTDQAIERAYQEAEFSKEDERAGSAPRRDVPLSAAC